MKITDPRPRDVDGDRMRFTPPKRNRIKRKAPRRTKDTAITDKEYLEWIASLPCVCCVNGIDRVICMAKGEYTWRDVAIMTANQKSPTEAAHVGNHAGYRRAPDRTAIPLCAEHHREGPASAHRFGRKFWQKHRLDRETLIAALNAAYDERVVTV